MDKEKLITKIIFGVEDLSEVSFPVSEEVRQNFEIAWDIWENFPKIQRNLKLEFLKGLSKKIEKELPVKEYGFTVFKLNHKSNPELYISKPDWQESYQDKGIYAIGIAKWGKGLVVGIVKNNKNFETSKESKIISILQSLGYEKPDGEWIGHIAFTISDREFYERILSDYGKLLEEALYYVEKVYKDLVENKDLLNLFEESVKERKRELNLDGVA